MPTSLRNGNQDNNVARQGTFVLRFECLQKGASVAINSAPINIFLFYNYSLCNSPRGN